MNALEKKEKLETAVKWIGGTGIVIVLGGVALVALTSIAAIAVTGVAGLALINGMPVIARKFASWKYKALRQDAIENPIPNLITLYDKEKALFKTMKQGVVQFSATVKNFQTKIDTYKAKNADVTSMQPLYDNMKRALAMQMMALEERQVLLNEFDEQIQEAQTAYNMALDMQAAGNALEAFSGQPVQDMMIRNEAFQAIQTKLNEQQARMEVTMQLDYNSLPAEVKNVDVVHLDQLTSRLNTLEVK